MMSASNWQESFCSWSDGSWQVNLVWVCVYVCVYMCGFKCEKNRGRGGRDRLRKSKGERDCACVWSQACTDVCLNSLSCECVRQCVYVRVTDGGGGGGGCMSDFDTSLEEGCRYSWTRVRPADKLRKTSTPRTDDSEPLEQRRLAVERQKSSSARVYCWHTHTGILNGE